MPKELMSIDWNAFTPWSSLAGGMLIGLAAGMFVLLNGRIAGISGVLGGLLTPVRGDVLWRVAFVGGIVVAPLAYSIFQALPPVQIDADYAALVVAGCWWVWARATAQVAPVGMVCAACRGCRCGHWPPLLPLWAQALQLYLCCVTF